MNKTVSMHFSRSPHPTTRGIRWLRGFICGCALGLMAIYGEAADAQAVSPSDVVRSVRAHHPAIVQAALRVEQAEGALMAARGGFDPVLTGRAGQRFGDRDSYYDLTRVEVALTQPTPLWGVEVTAGYRLFRGQNDRFPSYYSPTGDAGEVHLGLRVPLWRDGPLDSRRAARSRARIGIDVANLDLQAVELELLRAAVSTYFDFIASVEKLRIAEELEALAEARLSQVEARVTEGLLPEVESLEALRSTLRRRSAAISAVRSAQEKAIELSLYLRDNEGAPVVLGVHVSHGDVLPASDELGDLQEEAPEFLECHPAIVGRERQLDLARLAVRLARAQRGPELDVHAEVSRDFGSRPEALGGTVFEAGLSLSMPLALRTARGELEEAEARLAEVEQSLMFARDRLLAEARDIASAEAASRERLEIARALADATTRLAAAERARFEHGATTLMVVNLREQAMSEAAVEVVDAYRDVWLAHLRFEALRVPCR